MGLLHIRISILDWASHRVRVLPRIGQRVTVCQHRVYGCCPQRDTLFFTVQSKGHRKMEPALVYIREGRKERFIQVIEVGFGLLFKGWQ
jgi:hypothetical protein